MEIISHTVEKLIDPIGILSGERYEFFLSIQVDEEDELYRENGLKIKVLFVVKGEEREISHYYILEEGTDEVLEYELEEGELQQIEQYCNTHYQEAEN